MSGTSGQRRASVRAANTADRPAWDALVAERPEADPLQAWAWGEVNERHGERPVRLVLEAEGHIVGLAQLLVRPTTGGRAVGYVPHGPVWRRDVPSDLVALLDGLRRAARDARSIVVKLDPRALTPDPDADESDGRGDVVDERAEPAAATAAQAAVEASPEDDSDARIVREALLGAGLRPARLDLQASTTRIVDLRGDTDARWARWTPDARTRVRRAAKEGVTTMVDRDGDGVIVGQLAELHGTTAQRADFRPRSAAFLADVAAAFAPTGGWMAVEARLGGEPVAAMGFVRVGDRAAYLWGGSSRDPTVERSRAQYAVLGAAMDALAADGCRTLDLWGVIEAEDEASHPEAAGYSRFKRKFGGRPLRHPGTFDLVIDPLWFQLRDLRERLRGD